MDVTLYDSITKFAGAFYSSLTNSSHTQPSTEEKPYIKGALMNRDYVHTVPEPQYPTDQQPSDKNPDHSNKIYINDNSEKPKSRTSPKNIKKNDSDPVDEILLCEQSIEKSPDPQRHSKELETGNTGIKLKPVSSEHEPERKQTKDVSESNHHPHRKSRQNEDHNEKKSHELGNKLGSLKHIEATEPKTHDKKHIRDIDEEDLQSPETKSYGNVGLVEDFKEEEIHQQLEPHDNNEHVGGRQMVRKRHSRLLSRPVVHLNEGSNSHDNHNSENTTAQNHPRLVIKLGSHKNVNIGTKSEHENEQKEVETHVNNQPHKPKVDEIRKSMLDPLPKLNQVDLELVDSPTANLGQESDKNHQVRNGTLGSHLVQRNDDLDSQWKSNENETKPISGNKIRLPKASKDVEPRKVDNETDWNVHDQQQQPARFISKKPLNQESAVDMIDKLKKGQDTDSEEDEWKLDINTPAKKGKGLLIENKADAHHPKVALPAGKHITPKGPGTITYKPVGISSVAQVTQTTTQVTNKLGAKKKPVAPEDDSDNSWD